MDKFSKDWDQIKALFSQAMDKPADVRHAFIDKQNIDEEIKREVLSLLKSAEVTGPSFEALISEASIETSLVGQTNMLIKQYRIIELIGQGGMGEVYLAERADEQFEKQVALKLVSSHRPSPELVERFRLERQILATLEHPNIARLLDGGETDEGSPFLVMEYVDGLPIDQYCDENALDTRQRIHLFMQVCNAIQYAHRNLIVHRDVKASNILIDAEGKVKLLDFGIAKAIEQKDLELTRTAERVMSPLHASPEQIRGGAITVSTDVFSLGVLLYQLLSGLHPVTQQSSNAIEIERAICDTYPSKPSNRLSKMTTSSDLDSISRARAIKPMDLVKQLGGDLDNIVMKSLYKEPERRYGTVQEVIDDLQRFLNNRPVLARPSTLSYKSYKFLQRNRGISLVSAFAVALIFSISVFSYKQVIEERDTAREAQTSAEAISGYLQDIFSSVNPNVAKGEIVTALDLLGAGQNIIEESLADEPKTALIMHRVLAQSYYSLGNEEKALAQAKAALDIAEQYDPTNYQELATLTLLKGTIAQNLSDYDSAVKLMAQARAFAERAFTPPHYGLVEAIHSQAFLQDTLSKHDEAIALYQEAIKMNEKLPKGGAFDQGWSETRLSDVLRKEGRYQEGIEALQAAIPKMQANYGELHPYLSIAKRQLAMLFKDTKRYDESEALYIQVIEEHKKLYEPPAQELAITYSEYSLLLDKLERLEEAIDVANKNMHLLDQIFKGKPNASYGAAYNNHAFLLKKAGKYEASLTSFEKSIEQQDLIELAADHFHRSFPMHGMALTYIKMEEYKKAEDLLRRVLPMRLRHMDESHLYVTQVKSSLGDALMRQGKLDEAEIYLLDALKFFTQYQGEKGSEAELVRGFLDELDAMRNKNST